MFFTVILFFEPMIVQVQDFLKDVNAHCNIGITVFSFVSRVMKNDIKAPKIVAKWLKKTVLGDCIYISDFEISKQVCK